MNTQTKELSISEKIIEFVTASGIELTCLDVSRQFKLSSGTNLILAHLYKAGLINERIEKNGTRKYSCII